MKKLKLFVLWLCLCCAIYPESVNIILTVQPLAGTKILVGEKEVPYKIMSRDKTLGTVRFKLEEKSDFTVSSNGFINKQFKIPADGKSEYSFLAILDKSGSQCKFQNWFTSDGAPKSVRFIDNDIIVVTLLNGRGINIFNLKTGEKKLISPPEKYAQKTGFVESLVLKHKNELWISQMTTACIHVFSIPDFQYKTSIQSSGNWSKVMEYNEKRNRVYLSNWVSQDISIINPDTYKEEKRINAGAVPRGMCFSNDEDFIFLAQFNTPDGECHGKVRTVNLDTFKIVSGAGIPGAKRHIVKDKERELIYVSDMRNDIVEVFSISNNTETKLLTTINVYNNPNTICLTPDKTELLVSCRGPNNPEKGYNYKGYYMGQLYIIDTKTFKVKDRIEAGNQPTGLDISPNGKIIALSDFLDNRIRIYRKINTVWLQKTEKTIMEILMTVFSENK
ncbi:MAG: 40-residue YVTN family beta-propeller [Treponema sp.]|nr:MAG: 40-residue YVTN family beta-propeller [Treponema sp.]